MTRQVGLLCVLIVAIVSEAKTSFALTELRMIGGYLSLVPGNENLLTLFGNDENGNQFVFVTNPREAGFVIGPHGPGETVSPYSFNSTSNFPTSSLEINGTEISILEDGYMGIVNGSEFEITGPSVTLPDPAETRTFYIPVEFDVLFNIYLTSNPVLEDLVDYRIEAEGVGLAEIKNVLFDNAPDPDINEVLEANYILVANVPSIRGDFNEDGFADAADYTVWRDTFGTTVGVFNGADANGNAVVDLSDYSNWADNFGTVLGSAAATAVPEPSTIVLMLIALAMIVAYRK